MSIGGARAGENIQVDVHVRVAARPLTTLGACRRTQDSKNAKVAGPQETDKTRET